MKDNQGYKLIQSIQLRHSSWMEEGTHRSFIIEFHPNFDKLSLLIHFKHLSILKLIFHYRKKSAENRKNKKQHPQHKMRLSFDNTLELLTYLSIKSYEANWFEIRFKNGWVIKNDLLYGLEFITNDSNERDSLLEKFILISGQGPIDISSLEINEKYILGLDGSLTLKPLF